MGAVAVGVGLELMRRDFDARLAVRSGRRASKLLPALSPNNLLDLFSNKEQKPAKLPKGYEVHETVVYMSRVIRRED
jgi:hypothetical protein